MRAASAYAWRTAADARVRTLSFALIFWLYAIANAYGYGQTYPTLADRLEFARAFGENKAVRLFYGTPYHLDTIGGYCAWRVGGILALAAAFFGLLAASRAFRGDEESGRYELVAAGAVTRASTFVARVAAIVVTIGGLWLALLLGLVAGGLPVVGSAYLALAVVLTAAVYMAVGTLSSQLASTAREALEWGGVVLALDFVTRVVSDTTDVTALHWLTPLGWCEEARAFSGEHALALLLPAAATAAILAPALAIERRRDVGASLVAPRDTLQRPRLFFLRSPALLALQSQITSLIIWTSAVAFFAGILGAVSRSVAETQLPDSVKEQLVKFGAVDFTTARGYIGLIFLFFVVAIAFFGCSQLASIREEESEGRLETLFANPQGRTQWLAARLGLAVAGSFVIALASGLGAAAGVGIVGAGVGFGRLIEAGLNCLPASMLFLGIGALLLALFPRTGVGLSYAIIALAFVWELVGALLGVPSWMLQVSPFHQVGLMPAESFRAQQAAEMLGIGAAAAASAVAVFRRRDLAAG